MSSVADKLGFGPKRTIEHNPTDNSYTITVTPPKMFVPNAKPVQVKLSSSQFEGYLLWQNQGRLIQDVLGGLTSDQREMLMTGLGGFLARHAETR